MGAASLPFLQTTPRCVPASGSTNDAHGIAEGAHTQAGRFPAGSPDWSLTARSRTTYLRVADTPGGGRPHATQRRYRQAIWPRRSRRRPSPQVPIDFRLGYLNNPGRRCAPERFWPRRRAPQMPDLPARVHGGGRLVQVARSPFVSPVVLASRIILSSRPN
jgi:hypothetical protein